MKQWGILITAFYFLVLVFFIMPGLLIVAGFALDFSLEDWLELYSEWSIWLWIGVLVCGEGLLLFVSVDTSLKRLKPRQHVLVSVATITLMIALLTFAVGLSLWAGVLGDAASPFDPYLEFKFQAIAWVLALWCLWGAIFSFCLKSTSKEPNQLRTWLLKGSVLELLIAVTAHIIVRHREDCSAPLATSFGIATGIAMMLLCFGPSVLLLYHDRMNRRPKRRPWL